jgi:hypothetical protein
VFEWVEVFVAEHENEHQAADTDGKFEGDVSQIECNVVFVNEVNNLLED